MVNGVDANVNGTVLVSVQTWPVAVFVTVIVMVTVGLQPMVVFKVYVFPVPVGGVPQVDDQATEVTVQPPSTCDVLEKLIVLLPFNPQVMLLLKLALTGTCAVEEMVNVHPLQVMLAVTP